MSHLKCCQIANEAHELLIKSSHTWLCPQCNQPNFSQGFPKANENTLCSENQYSLLNSAGPVEDYIQNTDATSNNFTTNTKRYHSKRTKLTCLLINCRSLKNKVADLASIINEHQPDIILGNESWLNPDIASSEIFPDDYNVFRKDRPDGYGGVFQATKKDLIITQRSDLDTDCENIWTQCQLANKKAKSILFGSSCRPNVYDIKSLYEFDKSLFALGDKLLRQNVIVAGDFNAPNINWENHQISGNVSTFELLLEIIDKHDLHQLVREPTRRQLQTHNTLDLVLSNNRNPVSSIKVMPGISDHDIVLFTLNTRCRRKPSVKRKVYIRKKADSDRIMQKGIANVY